MLDNELLIVATILYSVFSVSGISLESLFAPTNLRLPELLNNNCDLIFGEADEKPITLPLSLSSDNAVVAYEYVSSPLSNSSVDVSAYINELVPSKLIFKLLISIVG